MKSLKFYSILGLSALFVLSACKKDDGTTSGSEENLTPVLSLGSTTLTVSADGGVASVAYQVENPVEGASVSVDLGDVTWITSYEVTSSSIDLTIESNSESSWRNATLTVSYPGAADVNLTVSQEIHFDYDFVATTAVATYYTHSGNVMNLDLIFTDMPYSGGYVTPPGTAVCLDTFMDYDADGKISPGTYEVSSSQTSYTINPGYYSYARSYDESGYYNAFYISSGTMTITESGEGYDITCYFETEEGVYVKCTYSGELSVDGMPEPNSTLTENITVDLTGSQVSAMAYNYDDYYSNGGRNWVVNFVPFAAGEGLTMDLNAEWGDVEYGIPTGTYTANASSSVYPAIGEYYVGYSWYGYQFGTWYYELDEYDNTLNQAPAVSGDITFTNNGDGTYKLEFACTDDAGYTWSGEWEGTILVYGSSYYSASTASSGKSSVVSKLSKKEMSAKAEEREAGLRVRK